MDQFRAISSVELRPVFTSLGLPPTAFVQPSSIKKAPFDAGTNYGPAYPDCLWLFQNADVYRFNIRTKQLEAGPDSLTTISNDWPPLFGSGVDAAVWAGPLYPNLHYFFRGDMVIRRNAMSGLIDLAPVNTVAHGFGSLRDTPLALEIGYGFADINTSHAGRLYLGKGNAIIPHNLNTGTATDPAESLSTKFKLSPDLHDVDVAFFGSGVDATTLYLFQGTRYVAVDALSGSQLIAGDIIDGFPALARFMPRPQLFLVENYTLSYFCSDPIRGEFINEITIMPRTKTTLTITSEYEESTTTTRTSSILSSTSEESSQQFNDQVQSQQESERSADTYAYDLQSSLHGKASANGIWGGEVNASLNVKGGSNDQRAHYADNTVSVVGKQVNESNKSLRQQVTSGTIGEDKKTKVEKYQEQTVDNGTSDKTIAIRFYQVVQPTLSVLSLTGANIAYANGSNGQGSARIVDISELGSVLSSALINDDDRVRARDIVTTILTNILDHDKQSQSFLDPECAAKGDLRQKRDLSTKVSQPGNGGTGIDVTVAGIAIEAKLFPVRMHETTTLTV